MKNSFAQKYAIKHHITVEQAEQCQIVKEYEKEHSITNQHECCIRCHRKLRSKKAKELGYGPICYRKMQKESKRFKKLF